VNFWKNLFGGGEPYKILVFTKDGSVLAKEARQLEEQKMLVSVEHDLKAVEEALGKDEITLLLIDVDRDDIQPAEIVFGLHERFLKLHIVAVGELEKTRKAAVISAGAILMLVGSFSLNRKVILKACKKARKAHKRGLKVEPPDMDSRKSSSFSGEHLRIGITSTESIALDPHKPKYLLAREGKRRSDLLPVDITMPVSQRKALVPDGPKKKQKVVREFLIPQP